jgi:aspartate-semialdehyde dehydrogenase
MASTTFSGPVTSTNGFIGAITGNVTGNITGDVIATVQALSGAGAVNVTDMFTSLTTTGASQALTLADGTAGQIKIISHVVDGGSAVLTPTTKIGFSTITFTAVGDGVTLIYTAAGWAIVGDRGVTIA